MGVVSQVLGNYGAAHEIEHLGRRYKFSLIDQRVKSAFEKARFQKAKAPLLLIKDDVSEAEFGRRLQEKIDLYDAGEYEIFSESSIKYMQTMQGMRLLLSLIVDCDEIELMSLILTKKDELVPLMGVILRESFPGLQIQPVAVSDSAPALSEPSAPAPKNV